MVAIDVRSGKAGCPGDVDRCAEALFYQYVVCLVVGSIWAVSGPPSETFVGVECVGYTEVVNRRKFKQSQASFIAVVAACAFPIFIDFCILVPLEN